jgi:hypothetical protein
VKRAWAERLTLSEGIDAVNRIVACYPNGGRDSGDGYIGAISAVLCGYPKMIALRCADLRVGIARSSKFLPAMAEIVAWCEREMDPIRWSLAWDERVEKGREVQQPQESPEQRARVIEKMDQFLEDIKSSLRPSPAARAAHEARSRAAMEKRKAEVAAEWGREPVPTIGGVPVSKELVAGMCEAQTPIE